ncbi:MAG: ABC transporter substrate-binding protein [Microbacteriaceae bacterium]
MHSTFSSPVVRKRWRTAGAVAVAAVLVGSLAACVQTPDDAPAPGAGGNKGDGTIYMVPGMTTHPAYQTLYCGAKEEAKKLGVGLEFQGATTWDPAQQIPVVQALLAKNPSALLLTPTDGTALAPVVNQYISAGIPVLTIDTGLEDTSKLAGVIASSNVQGGGAAGAALGKAIGGKGSVAIISGAPGATTDVDRVKGFTDELAANYPDVKILEIQYSKSNAATAASQVQALMLANPDLSGVFGVNGNSATGAANAIAQAGMKGKIRVAGYDAEPATVKLLKDGSIEILVVQDFVQEGKLGVQYAFAAMNGDTADIPKETVLDNIIATTANSSDPEISKYFYIESCN